METKDFNYYEYVLRCFPDKSWQIRKGDDCVKYIPVGTSRNQAKKAVREMKFGTEVCCPPAVLVSTPIKPWEKPAPLSFFECVQPTQGTSPMKMNTLSTDLTINTSAAPSDAMKQREYLLSELNARTRYSWKDPVLKALAEKFHLNAPTIPETSAEIIDAFKNGDVTIDQKKVDAQTKFFAARAKDEDFDMDDYDCEDSNGTYIGGRYYGVTFTKLPVSDRPGYNAAVKEYQALTTATERKINIMSPEDGLAALMAFEAWLPTAADTKH